MKNQISSKMLLTLFVILFVFSTALNVSADSQTYTPPAQKGYIYIVVKYKGSFSHPMKTNIKLDWGGYSRSEDISPPFFALPNNIPEGFVIRLTHKKNDSMAVDVSTNGRIVRIYQGDAPSQSSQKGWKQLNW